MIVALDNTVLSLVFHPSAKPSANPATGKPIEHCALRVQALIDQHSTRNDTVIIPTPCLSELLVVVPDFAKVISEIKRSAAFEVAAFDVRASIDLAEEVRKSIAAGGKKSGVEAGWNEIKFDRQIAMIAKVYGADILYTDDSNQTIFAEKIGLKVTHTWDLDLPPKYAQGVINFDGEQ